MKKPVRILIVEDNPADVDLAKYEICKTFKDCQFQVVEARDPFIRALDTFQPDLILADYTLPNFDGLDALKLTLQHAPSTPFIIWTGSTSEDAAVECMRAGASNYIIKDNLKRLGPAVIRALDEKAVSVARRQAEQRYQSIFENSAEGIFQSLPEGRYLSLNPAMARIYGYDSSAEMLESIQDIAVQIYVDPDRRAEFMGLLNSQDSVEKFEARNYRKDGSIIWTSTSARAVRDRHGKVLYYEGFSQDVTQQKRMEEALQHSEQRFRALLQNGLDDISLLAVDGTLLWESPSTIRNLGYAPDEFVGHNMFEIMHPEDVAWTRNTFLQLLQVPGSRQSGIFRLRHADGTWRWVEAIATNMLHEPYINAIVINYHDITEQKKAEIELQQRNADLALINGLNEAINRGEDVHTVVNLMAKEIKRNFSAEGATVYLMSPDGRSLRMQQYFLASNVLGRIEALIGRTIPSIEIPIREGGYFHSALEAGHGVIASDPHMIQKWMEEFVETAFLPQASRRMIRKLIPQIYKLLNLKSAILIPLISDGKAIGLLDISSPNLFTQEDLQRLENIGRQLTIAIRRKQVEDALRESQIRYQNLVETSHDLIWSVDAEGRITFLNRAARQIYGYEPEELIGRYFFELLDPQHHQPLEPGTFKQSVEAANEFHGVESYVRHRDGRQIILSANSIVLRDENGRLTGVTGSSHDITERKHVEDSLKEERNLLRTLIDNIPDRIYAMDMQGRKTLSNTADWKASGAKTMEDVIGKTDFETYPHDLAEEFWRLDRAVLDTGQPLVNYEEPGLDADGNIVSILTSKIPLRDDEGRVMGLVGIGRDVTERKQTQQRINDLLAFNEKVLNHSPMGIITYKFTGEFVFANENAALIAGTDIEQLKTLNFHTLESWRKSGFYDIVQKAMTSLSPVTADIHHTSIFGKSVWMTVHCTTFKLKGEDHLLIFLTDITERKRTDEKLHRNESRYRLATKATNDVIWEWDPKTDQLDWSENAQHVFGYPAEEIRNEVIWWEERIHPEDRERVLTTLDDFAAGRESIWIQEYRFLLKDGSYARISDRSYIERDENAGALRMIGAMSDITARKEAETERQALLEIMQGLANTNDLQELLSLIHHAIAKVIYAENFFVILHQEKSGLFEEIYSVDQYDPPAPPSRLENSITSYVFRSGKPLLLTQHSFDELAAQGEVTLVGTDSASWLGVPLKTSGRTIGVMAVQDYEKDNRYSDRDKEFLTSIATQVALVIERKQAEERLRASEERFSSAFEHAAIGMALVTPEGHWSRVNRGLCQLLGYSEAELLQKTFQDITHPDDLQSDLAYIGQVLAGEIDTYQLEKRYYHKSGHVVWVLLSVSLVRDGQGTPQYFISQIQDITERKKAEMELVESNIRFRTLFEASPDAIVLIDPRDDWRIIDCNTAACRMNGYEPEELIGQPIDMLNATPSEEERRGEYIENIRRAGVMHLEALHRRKDGSIFTADISTSMLRLGNRDVILGIDRDVTERKRAEDQLRFEKERFDGIAAAVPGIICSFRMRPDGSTCMPFASPAIQDVYGLLPQDVEHDATPLFAQIHPDNLPQLIASIMDSAKTMLPWHSEFRYEHPVKGERWIEGQSVPLREEDGSIIWHGFIHDVTERKLAEEEIRRSAKETSALLETSLALGQLDLEATLQTVGSSANSLFLADGCRIFLMEPDEETLHCVLALGENTDVFSNLRIKVGQGVTGAVAAQGQAEIVNEMHNDPRAVQVPGTDEEQEAIMFAPLKDRDRTIGILSIRRLGGKHPFQPEDLGLLEAFASMAASAVSKARLFEETQHRLAELRASEERFLQLADNIQEGFWITDAETGQELYLSPAVGTILGRSVKSLMSEPNGFINCILPEDQPAMMAAIEQERSGERAEVEYRVVWPDGSIRWLWDRAFPVFDDSGKVKRITGISADITERKQAEQELRKLSHAVEQSGSSIIITDRSGKIEYVNSKFTQVTGYSFEEVIGQNPRILKSGFTADEEYEQLWQIISSGRDWHGELLNRKKNGEFFWESVTISPILNDRREITHYVGVKEDITERKETEIETRRHIAELEALYENGLSVGRLLGPGEIGNRVIDTFGRYLPWHHVTIRLRKEDSDDLELVAFNLPNLKEEERTEAERHFVARISKVGQGLSGWVIQTGTPFRTGNVHAHPQYIDTHAGIQSGLYMPLKVGDRVIGVISVESEDPNAFTAQDERLLATLANQTAIAFENARLYEAMQKELSERKRVEDALRISETHYRALADSITDILFELDQNLRYTHWNKASEVLLAIPANEAIGKSMEEILGANEEQTRMGAIYQDVLHSHQPRTFETILVIHGESRSFEVNAYPSMRGVSVVAKDVTDRKRTETIMQKRFELMEYSARHSLKELMQKTVDEVSELTGSTIGFFHFMDEDQVSLGMQTWSTNALQLFAVPIQEGGHRPLDQAGVWAEAIRQRRPLIQNDYESLAERKGFPQGHVPIFREIVIPIIRNERIMAVMGIGNKPQQYATHDLEIAVRLADYAWDITERKQMEVALEIERNQLVQRVEERTADLSRANANLARALRVKDEFLANMSHELRTPLNAILGLSESLTEQIAGPLNEKQQKYISTISESGHHLLSLINDILDLAKIEAGQITMDINKVDIRSVCQASLRMIKQLAQKKNQDVSLEIDKGLGLMWADERRLKQMIVNLLGNAVKFTPENGRLGLEVHGDEEANEISITTWDNGIGIKPEDLERLFQPFVQLDSGLAREATGTGLGLALVAQMARLHGGSVNAYSEPGKGSRFTIVLPWEPALAMDAASRMRITGKFRAIQFDEKNKPNILLVEDTQEVVMMLRDYLELAGYNVFTAQDGLDGIAQARHVKPDLILMDIQMPRMNGFETARKLRSDPDFRYTPIIALTALAMPHDRERCLEAGMDDYISKPVNLKALIKIIQNCLFEREPRAR